MTHLFHLAFLGRSARQVGDSVEYLDGKPAPTAQELADSYAGALAAWEAARNPPKRWDSTEAFMAEFSMTEIAAISLSTDPTIAALRFMLSTWLSAVHSDDARVIQGMAALVSVGIISEQRKGRFWVDRLSSFCHVP